MSKKLSNNVFKKKSGIQNIQEYLETGRSLTALEALSNFGIFRLASAIEVLRKRGMSIETEMKEDPNGKTYARYTLVVPVEAEQEPEVKAEEAQPKFRVGDRVKVSEGYPLDDLADAYTAGRRNKTGVVAEAAYDLPYPIRVTLEGDDYGVLFLAEELTLLPAEAPKKELKVGARVRTFAFYEETGEEAVIESAFEGFCDYHWNILCDGDKYTVPVRSDELEAI